MSSKTRVCKNCKFWGVEAKCCSPKFRYEVTKVLSEPPDKDGIMIEYDEEWGTVCGPEFGCIHFQESI